MSRPKASAASSSSDAGSPGDTSASCRNSRNAVHPEPSALRAWRHAAALRKGDVQPLTAMGREFVLWRDMQGIASPLMRFRHWAEQFETEDEVPAPAPLRRIEIAAHA